MQNETFHCRRAASIPLTLALGICFGACQLLPPPVAAQDSSANAANQGVTLPDFNRDVKPLLSSRCFLCHGPDESSREAGLRLDTFAGVIESGVIEPGDIQSSELFHRVTSDDESEVMPPPEHGKPLSDQEVEIFKRWIAGGAKYETHWSYVSPVQATVPTFEQSPHHEFVRNAVDAFVLEKIQQRGLTPSPAADRITLARRVSLDLTGLPPTPEAADQFASDPSPNAYEKFVDRLLASPAYAEHWAATWLDLARYADSAGYAEDKKRTIWAYRDYVIRAYESNKPFDQFTIEQIAGDLIENATDETRVATAFHRNTLTNSEGGTDDEEFRSAAVVDRTNTTMAVWMGTTMACAQCHTHKYDPITQAEYFQVYAMLNNTADNDQPNEAPVMPLFSPEQLAARQAISTRIADLQTELQTIRAESPQQRTQRLDTEVDAWQQAFISQKDAAQSPLQGRFVRVELPRPGMLSLAEVEVFGGTSTGASDEDNRQTANIALGKSATQSSTGFGGPPEFAVDGNTSGVFTDRSVTHTVDETNPWWQVDLGDPMPIESIRIWNRTDESVGQRLDGFRVSILDSAGEPLWSQTFDQAPATEQLITVGLPAHIAKLLQLESSRHTPEQRLALREFYASNFATEKKLSLKVAALQAELKQVAPTTSTPVMQELPANQRRETRIQLRGSYANLGDVVEAGTPAALHPISEEIAKLSRGNDRLALAYWLVDRANPLTARVVVNRYWQRLFGKGLVVTSEDFGAQGEMPTHAELLDYLAVQYMDSGWDNRALLKSIVMSATYRQSSRATPEQLSLDADNQWLARGPRFRVSAEMVRDQALFASGLLSEKRYGPPVQPPAPELGLRAAFSGSIDWKASTGEDRYRRAIYTEWRRSSPYPSMETFDISNREVCDLRRVRTNTPLQALVTLNDEVYVEAAQAMARKMIARNSEPREIATVGFRSILIRQPTSAELDELVRLYEQSKKHFAESPEDARAFAIDPLHPVAESTDLVELASWTTVANVLLNLDEVFSKP